jgi:hypothetical protein
MGAQDLESLGCGSVAHASKFTRTEVVGDGPALQALPQL